MTAVPTTAPLVFLGVVTLIIVLAPSPAVSACTVPPLPATTGIVVLPEFSATISVSGFATGFKSTRLMVATAVLPVLPY